MILVATPYIKTPLTDKLPQFHKPFLTDKFQEIVKIIIILLSTVFVRHFAYF